MTEPALKIHRDPINDNAVTQAVLRSLGTADRFMVPYDYWLLEQVLPVDVVHDIASLPVDVPQGLSFYGKREANNASRVYFTPENQEKYAVCAKVVDSFKSQPVLKAIQSLTGRDVSLGALRIEYCQDTDGFWLEPHVDISVKLFTMLVYLSDDPNLADAGTDIYDDTPDHNIVATAPYKMNTGMIFIPGKKTWHGFSKRPIRGLRKSIIVNYVTSDWQAQGELA